MLEEKERKEFDVTYDFVLDFLFEDGILYAGYDIALEFWCIFSDLCCTWSIEVVNESFYVNLGLIFF